MLTILDVAEYSFLRTLRQVGSNELVDALGGLIDSNGSVNLGGSLMAALCQT